ncbi:MAG: carbohydate-binding domain-containing protein [Saprospiraceae bacterium]|nr:carbohydate-binding domain-containing protein [Saprospiraceae bacterium]
MQRLFFVLLILSCSFACTSEKEMNVGQQLEELSIQWQLVSNQIGEEAVYRSKFTLTNNSYKAFAATNWGLYYNQTNRKVRAGTTQGPAVVELLKGDFYRLSPSTEFNIPAGESLEITWDLDAWAIKEVDAPMGLYFAYEEVGGETEIVKVSNYEVLPFTKADQINRFTSDKTPIPTAGNRFEQNQRLSLLAAEEIAPIIPAPQSYQRKPGGFAWTEEVLVNYTKELEKEANYLSDYMQQHFNKKIQLAEGPGNGQVQLNLGTTGKAEGYRLLVDPERIDLVGQDAAGVFYGIQSLLGLVPVANYEEKSTALEIPAISIEDAPGFEYRGLHLDLARNFNSPTTVKKVIEVMGFYKLNKLHLHLTDDEGWRLAIEELPELTAVGARRGHTTTETEFLQPAYGSGPDPDDRNSHGNGFITREEFKDIIKWAHDRHIEVIPELNVPGHARAAIKSMEARYRRLMEAGEKEAAEQYLLTDFEDKSKYESVQFYPDNVVCVCKESVYSFYETIVDDVIEMFSEAEVPLKTIHTGGDEVPSGVWTDSPICQELIAQDPSLNSPADLSTYFIGRINKILSERGLVTAGWEEIAMLKQEDGSYIAHPDFVDANFLPYVWQNLWGNQDLGHRLANAGYPIVICNVTNLYFDLAYDKDPEEPGFYWGGFIDTRKAYEILPYDVLKSTTHDPLGEPFDLDEDYKDMAPLKAPQNVRGIQGELWSETVKGASMLEYYLLPKLMGLAERAWSPRPDWGNIEDHEQRAAALDQAWNEFANVLGQKELKRLDYLFGGFDFRLPLPGAIVEDGQLKANIAFPGLDLYLTDGSLYQGPIDITQDMQIEARTAKRKSRVVTVKKPGDILD